MGFKLGSSRRASKAPNQSHLSNVNCHPLKWIASTISHDSKTLTNMEDVKMSKCLFINLLLACEINSSNIAKGLQINIAVTAGYFRTF